MQRNQITVYDQTEVEVCGTKFEIYALDALQAHPFWLGLVKALGPGFAAASGHDDEGALLAFLGAAISNMPEDLVERMRSAFAKKSAIEVAPNQRPMVSEVYGQVFSRKPKMAALWFAECVKFNFADFLDGDLQAKIAGLMARAPSASKSPST